MNALDELCPRRCPHVEAHQRVDGTRRVTVLKHRGTFTYYRLSSLGTFVWHRLDGSRSIATLQCEVERAGGAVACASVPSLLHGWSVRGLVVGLPLAQSARSEDESWLARASAVCFAALTWRRTWTRADPFTAALHGMLGRHFFTRGAVTALAALSTAGLLAFVTLIAQGWMRTARAAQFGSSEILALVASLQLATVLHELAHALAVKHFRREVVGMGFGWHWFGPCFFVNTSDMWLAPRRERVLVSLAGPALDVGLGGGAALLCSVAPQSLAPYLFVFSANLYLRTVFNLCPLMQGDGYCVLVDLTGRENLRRNALGWWVRRLPSDWRDLAALRTHAFEIAYGAGSIAYLLASAWLSVWIWRDLATHVLTRVLPERGVAALAWFFVTTAAVAFVAALACDLRVNARTTKGNL
jgi:putative peptide zinc metalloprotease protein